MFKRLFAAIVIAAGLAASPVYAADLTVTVRGVRSADGLISIAVFNSADTFLTAGSQLRSMTIDATHGEVPVVFKDLPPGSYAAAAYHDENANGDFDTDFFGIPEEGYGFSNGARASFGPPSFAKAVVTVTVAVDADIQTSVAMTY